LDNLKLIVLGTAQDGGYPHAGCWKECCRDAWNNINLHRYVSCLGIADIDSGSFWIIDATPDFKYQLNSLKEKFPECNLKGIFITHAHTGHYTGLIHFGKEIMGSDRVPVRAMPRMKLFLENNLPWKQLIDSENVIINEMNDEKEVKLNDKLSITPFNVPHRDEHSETAGFEIKMNSKKVLYIPDIDSWKQWKKNVKEEIKKCDLAFIDGTFFRKKEIKNFDELNIPHPTVEESMKEFDSLKGKDRKKIYFIHFNHTNPLIKDNSEEKKEVILNGFNTAFVGMVFE